MAYAGSKEGNRYSSNDQVNIDNVASLKIAWTFSSGDRDSNNRSQNQCNPIMVDGVLYGTSPRLTLLAIDAATGKLKWQFLPSSVDTTANKDPYAYFKISRGVMYWQNESGTDKRIYYAAGSKIFAINAINGQAILNFGKGGFIDLAEHADREDGLIILSSFPAHPGLSIKTQ